MRRLTRSDLFFILLPLLIVAVAATMHATSEQVSWFGWDVPVVCVYRRLTGAPCLGCGLTRSFVLLVHGAWLDAFRANPLGPPLFAALVVQSPLVLLSRLRSAAR